jgi:hypothetical protein
MSGVWYKRRTWNNKVAIFKRVSAGGDRQMADGMSDAFAAKVVRLLNEDEARNENYVLQRHLSRVHEPTPPPEGPIAGT